MFVSLVGGTLGTWMAGIVAGIVVWTAQKGDPERELIQRLRQPVRWACDHPWQAIRRLVR